MKSWSLHNSIKRLYNFFLQWRYCLSRSTTHPPCFLSRNIMKNTETIPLPYAWHNYWTADLVLFRCFISIQGRYWSIFNSPVPFFCIHSVKDMFTVWIRKSIYQKSSLCFPFQCCIDYFSSVWYHYCSCVLFLTLPFQMKDFSG